MKGMLDIDSSEKLTGTMTRTEWGAGGQVVCQANYSVTMFKAAY
jgi:hypothetical protein